MKVKYTVKLSFVLSFIFLLKRKKAFGFNYLVVFKWKSYGCKVVRSTTWQYFRIIE